MCFGDQTYTIMFVRQALYPRDIFPAYKSHGFRQGHCGVIITWRLISSHWSSALWGNKGNVWQGPSGLLYISALCLGQASDQEGKSFCNIASSEEWVYLKMNKMSSSRELGCQHSFGRRLFLISPLYFHFSYVLFPGFIHSMMYPRNIDFIHKS